jgi:Aspartyl protease
VTNLWWIASFVVAATMASALSAETRCPGNVESVPLRAVNGYQMIVGVEVNHSGPYSFLLDTGTQFTMIDPSLAEELGAKGEDAIPVNGTGFRSAASSTLLGPVELGSHAVAHVAAVVFSLKNLKATGLAIRGVLGEDFLMHFDMLIDNEHRMLCLDEGDAMREEVKGPRMATMTSTETEEVPPNSLLLTVQLSDVPRPIRLKLDSGATASVLYSSARYPAQRLVRGRLWHGNGTDGAQRSFAALPVQQVKIESLELRSVPFFALAESGKDSGNADFDGLLTTGLFKRVFVDHADHFAVLEAW